MALAIGSYNIHFNLQPDHVESELTRLLGTRAQVIGLQEFWDNRRIPGLRRAARAHGWEFWRPDDLKAQRQDPLLWNARVWEAVQTGAQRLNDEVDAEPGSGGANIESKWAPWVILRRRSDGVRIAIANWHAPATVTDSSKPLRQKALEQGAIAIRDLMKDLRPDVDHRFVVGDINVDYHRTDYRRRVGYPVVEWAKVGLTPCWQHALFVSSKSTVTEAHRIIDYVFASQKPRRVRILRGYASDHKPILAFYGI